MNLRQLHDAARAALLDASHPQAPRQAANMALHLAEMVGWAPGLIDPKGEVGSMLDALRSESRARYEADSRSDIAALHDAIADLMDAIARHDRDLDPRAADDDVLVSSA